MFNDNRWIEKFKLFIIYVILPDRDILTPHGALAAYPTKL